MYILRPHAAGILYPPPFYTPPHPWEGLFRGGGGACKKIWPRILVRVQGRGSQETPPKNDTFKMTLGSARNLLPSRRQLVFDTLPRRQKEWERACLRCIAQWTARP